MNITDRGYTGHEHLSPFGDDSNGGFCLINMNGRIYDPVLARFLSPDPYVQAPDFTQSFNRYAYGWNNPFKYIDPSGEVIVSSMLIAAIGGTINLISKWHDGIKFGEGFISSTKLLKSRILNFKYTTMVRNLIFCFSLILLFGCSNQDYILVQNNDLLRFENYPDDSELTFSFAGTFQFNGDSFDAQKQTKKILISGQDSIFISKVINKFTDSYYEHKKNNIEPDYSEKKTIHLCGELDLVDGISSYVVSIETPAKNIDDVFSTSFIELYLLNFNDYQLASNILLSLHSPYLAESSVINTYMMNKSYFSQIDYANSTTNISLESYIPHSVIPDLFNIKNNIKALYFSLFTINERGFVNKITL